MKKKGNCNRFWRRVLRSLALCALLTELVFSIIIPKVNGKPVYLDKNDGWIIFISISLLISIASVKMFIKRYSKKSNKLN